MRSRFPLLILLLFGCLLASCTRDNSRQEKSTFHLNLVAGLESLDPAFAKDNNTMWAAHMIYNTLVETDTQLHLIPSLAKRWEVSGDGLLYTFILHDSVYFQDNPLFPDWMGRRMTAADVV